MLYQQTEEWARMKVMAMGTGCVDLVGGACLASALVLAKGLDCTAIGR